jgi:hypothetical protein
MEKTDKRDLMAALLMQKVMGDKVIWLGDHKEKNEDAKIDEVYKTYFKSMVVGTYVLVDKMLADNNS